VATLIALAALVTSLAQLRQARLASKVQALSDVMHESSQILMWAAHDPEAYAFFERDIFGQGRSPRRTLADLARAEPATRMRVQIVCETLADFFDSTYDRRDQFEPKDWDAWWSYMRSLYDESPILQEYFKRRGDWYDVDEALAEASDSRPGSR
jgi:hypothetical protein